MTFLPIVGRELRVAARRPATYWVRFFAAVGVMVVWLFLVMTGWRLAPAALSRNLFVAFGVLSLGFCLLAGIFFTADCLSSEKREGTLGLLFLTDLRGYDVVLGKLMATSLHAVYGLLAIFPVLALPLLMGGVTVGEFWRVVLVLVATLLLSLGMGMFVSAWQVETRQTMTATFLGMLLLAGGVPALWWLRFVVSGGRPSGALLLPSPVNAFGCAFDAVYRTRSGPSEFWVSLFLVALLGLLLLVLATLVLPRAWQERPRPSPLRLDSSGGRRTFNWTAGSGFPPGEGLNANLSWRTVLEGNPFLWLASRSRAFGGPLRAVAILLVLIWACFFVAALETSRNKEAFVGCLFAAYALHQVFKYALALESTRHLSEGRQSGALELLLVTPLTEAEIVEGQTRSLAYQFRGFAGVLLMVTLALCASVLVSRKLDMNATDQAIFLELFIGGTLMLWLDFKAISHVGIWMALRCKRHNRAVLATLGRVMLVPWAAIFLLIFLAQGVNPNAEEVGFFFALWFGIGIITDGVMLVRSRAALSAGFRAFLVQHSTAPTQVPVLAGAQLRAQHA